MRQSATNPKQWPPAGVDWYYSDAQCCIACGDCREILPTLPKVDLVLTDPPYGIAHASGHGASWQNTTIAGDDDTARRRLHRFCALDREPILTRHIFLSDGRLCPRRLRRRGCALPPGLDLDCVRGD